MQGRSATDSHDQLRKKLSLATRRVVRSGTKGILFAVDIAMTNGHIVHNFLAHKAGLHPNVVRQRTKVCYLPQHLHSTARLHSHSTPCASPYAHHVHVHISLRMRLCS